jgi:hypothetical protein
MLLPVSMRMLLQEAVMNTLHKQQRDFARFMTENADESSRLSSLILKQSESPRFSPEQRLQVYRNNFLISLREALAGVYPVIRKLVGDEFFQHVTREYVRQHPSRSGNLHDFGDEVANFLQDFRGLEALPYLADVARLEWAYHQVFHTSEQRVLNIGELASLDEAQTAGLVFQVSSGCVFFASDYPVLSIWQANQDDNEEMTVSLDEGGDQLVVMRDGQQIEFHSLPAGVFTLLESLAQNKPFAQACEHALNLDANCDIAAALRFLVQEKIVVGFSYAHIE